MFATHNLRVTRVTRNSGHLLLEVTDLSLQCQDLPGGAIGRLAAGQRLEKWVKCLPFGYNNNGIWSNMPEYALNMVKLPGGKHGTKLLQTAGSCGPLWHFY